MIETGCRGRPRPSYYGPDEAVAAAGDGMNEARVIGIITEDLADLSDGGIDAVLCIDEDFDAPEACGDFTTSDNIAFAGSEEDQQFHGLVLQPEKPLTA